MAEARPTPTAASRTCSGARLEAGTYRLRFVLDDRSSFFAALAVDILVEDVGRSYHVPLLLSPFGLSTYLGG